MLHHRHLTWSYHKLRVVKQAIIYYNNRSSRTLYSVSVEATICRCYIKWFSWKFRKTHGETRLSVSLFKETLRFSFLKRLTRLFFSVKFGKLSKTPFTEHLCMAAFGSLCLEQVFCLVCYYATITCLNIVSAV